MSIRDLPDGATCSDQRWQDGYNDGCNEDRPTLDDPVYVAGWCTGYMGGIQCGEKEAVKAYYEIQGIPHA